MLHRISYKEIRGYSKSHSLLTKPGQEEYTELARFKIADLPVYAHPVIAGDRIYIRDEKTVSLWRMK